MEDIPHSRIYGNRKDIDTCRCMAVISSLPLHILLSSDGNPGYEILRGTIPNIEKFPLIYHLYILYCYLLLIILEILIVNIICPNQNTHIKIGSFISAPSNPS